jgi:hypothetical protein
MARPFGGRCLGAVIPDALPIGTRAPMGFAQEGIMSCPLTAQGQKTIATSLKREQVRKNSTIVDGMKEVSPADGAVGLQEMLMAAWLRQISMTILQAKPAIRSGTIGHARAPRLWGRSTPPRRHSACHP